MSKNSEPVGASSSESNEGDFLALYLRHEGNLRGYIHSLLGNWDDAKEVMQQVSMILWRKFETLEDASGFRPWAFQVARFEVMNFRRKRSRSPLEFNDELLLKIADEGEAESDRREAEREALQACLLDLKGEQRELVQRCYGEDRSMIQDIAEELGKTRNALYKLLHRTRGQLLNCVSGKLAKEGY